jgi:hypothetical protein
MSCFTIPQWRYIVLKKEQRDKLAKVDVQELVRSWEKENLPPADRVYFLKIRMQVSTFIEQNEDLQRPVLDIPQGLVCMHTPPDAKKLLYDTNIALGLLFEHLQFPKNETSGLTIFDRFKIHSPVAKPREIRSFLKSHKKFEVIDRFWSVYMNILARHFCRSMDVTPDHIEQLMSDHCDMSILKYDDLSGFFMHIDGLVNTDATVFTVGVGRDVVYDMTRAIGRDPHEVSIIRSSNPEGTMMLLDGESRYKWAHGVPGSHKHNGVKYTIIIRLYHTAGLVRPIGKCTELNTEMYSIEPEPQSETQSNTHIGAQRELVLDLLMQLKKHTSEMQENKI